VAVRLVESNPDWRRWILRPRLPLVMRVATPITRSPEERAELDFRSRGRSTPLRLALRACKVLRAVEGRVNQDIAEELHNRPNIVGLRQQRSALLRLEGIRPGAPRPGPNPTIPTEPIDKIEKPRSTPNPQASPAGRPKPWPIIPG
jgi:hypothetical protein